MLNFERLIIIINLYLHSLNSKKITTEIKKNTIRLVWKGYNSFQIKTVKADFSHHISRKCVVGRVCMIVDKTLQKKKNLGKCNASVYNHHGKQ